jgi:hypothetical protein
MRVRCSFCSAEYDTPVPRAALVLVDRCEHCGRARLEAIDDGDGTEDREPPVSRLRRPPPDS